MFIRKILFGVFIISWLISCKNETADPVEVCFERDVLPILSNSCAYNDCHNPDDRAGGIQLTTYNGVLRAVTPNNYRASKLYTSMVTFPVMPPKPYDRLGVEDLSIIAAWIEQGAKNNSCPPANCDTTNVSLSADVRPILTKYCGGCHLTNNPQGNVDFRTYDDLRIYVDDGSLTGSINHISPWSQMPKGSGKIPACSINIIDAWLHNGALNN